MRAYTKIILLLSLLTLTGAGCISIGGKGSEAQGAGGGIFKSTDRGEEWQQKVAIPTPQGVKNFGGGSVTVLSVDPQDHLALYVGTRENGLFYSYDGGESWRQAQDVSSGFVAAVEVDPKNKCIIYVATGNRILKSIDCNRTFEPVYNHADPTAFVAALAIDPGNALVLYAGGAKGAVIKSVDGGQSWSNQGNLRGKIIDLRIDPRATGTIYAAIAGRGVSKSVNSAETFTDFSEKLKDIKDAKDVRKLVIDPATPSALYLASRNKLMRTADGGSTWTALPIISPENIEILALAVNSKNSKELYYGTATTFYRSLDGGERWSTEKLPTRRQASALLVDPQEPHVVYLGVLEVKK